MYVPAAWLYLTLAGLLMVPAVFDTYRLVRR